MRTLHLLCVGPAIGLVEALTASFEQRTGATLRLLTGTVGALKDALMGGTPCDVLVVPDAMLRALQGNGAIEPDGAVQLGRVRIGVAARAGEAAPQVDSADALKAALLVTPAFYVPDILTSTAGQHIASVLAQLDVRRALGARLMVYPHGSAAMGTLATRGVPGSLGATHVTEILCTPGLMLAGVLPDPFGRATVYSAGISSTANDVSLAADFLASLRGDEGTVLGRRLGFEPLDA